MCFKGGGGYSEIRSKASESGPGALRKRKVTPLERGAMLTGNHIYRTRD